MLASRFQTGYRSRVVLLLGLVLGLLCLMLIMASSIAFGAADIDLETIWQALFAFDSSSTNHLIIRTLRIPRAVIAVIVGAALAVTGAIMQGLTRNPLADPGILGIETGAALGVVTAVFTGQINSMFGYAWSAFLGAGITAITVYGLGSLGRGGTTPLKLTIAGAAITSFLASLTTAMLIFNQRTLEEVRFWLAGSVAGRDLELVGWVLPYILVGFCLALALGRHITTMALGEDVAKGLGQRTGWIKVGSAVAVILLAGSAVAIAGPIGFVGLIVPHIVRAFIGQDYRWILPYAAIFGAIFLVFADILGRIILRPMEMPIGVMTALIGGPFFIYIVRWRIRR